MATPQIKVLTDGIDLYSLGYVSDSIDVSESKTFQKSKLYDNTITINARNYDDFFSVENSKSLFSGIDYLYQPVVINDIRGVTIWDGVISDIRRDHNSKMAVIESKSYLSKWQDINIAYVSSAWETPASAIKNIFTAYGFTNYDPASLQTSIDMLTANSCYCKVRFSLSDNITFFSGIEKLCEYACAYGYMSKGNIFIKHWTPFTGGVSAQIAMKDIVKSPNVKLLFSDIINEYNIGYNEDLQVSIKDSSGGGNIASVSRTKYNTHALPDMISSGDGQITYKDSTSAIYIGESYIRRSHYTLSTQPRPLYEIEFSLSYDFYSLIDIGSYFKITFTDEEWISKVFEVFAISPDVRAYQIGITAVEVDDT